MRQRLFGDNITDLAAIIQGSLGIVVAGGTMMTMRRGATEEV